MKPIEPGCKCLIIKDDYYPENVGKEVTAIRVYDPGTRFFFSLKDGTMGGFITAGRCWSVSETIPAVVFLRSGTGFERSQIFDINESGCLVNGLVGERRLMRIDGEDFDDNPYQEKKPVSDTLTELQTKWLESPQVWDQFSS
ncbi:hypothetical protein [Klebsiella phage YC1]|nr:hypothetical protein [Klebsiella phage YC1]